MMLPQHVRLVDVGPRDGLQNEKATVPTDVKVATDRHARRRGLSRRRGDGVRLAEVGAADGRRRRRDGADRAQGRRSLSGADAEPQGLRGRARRACRRSRRVRRRERNASRARTSTARSPRASSAREPVFDAAKAAGRARARLHLVRARLPVRRRHRSAQGGRGRRRAARDGRVRSLARRHDRHRHRRQDAGAGRASSRSAFRSTRSPVISTTRTARRSPTSTRRWKPASPRSTARWPGSAAVRTRRARPATSRARTSSTCWRVSASRPVSTCESCARAGQYISDFLGRAAGVARRARARREGSAA